jgi:hypothetical protein
MPDTEQAFLTEMALQLEATIRQLEEREAQLAALLGLPRVEELKKAWAKQLDPLDEKEFKAVRFTADGALWLCPSVPGAPRSYASWPRRRAAF